MLCWSNVRMVMGMWSQFIDSTFMTHQRRCICLSARWRRAYLTTQQRCCCCCCCCGSGVHRFMPSYRIRMNIVPLICRPSIWDPCITQRNIIHTCLLQYYVTDNCQAPNVKRQQTYKKPYSAAVLRQLIRTLNWGRKTKLLCIILRPFVLS